MNRDRMATEEQAREIKSRHSPELLQRPGVEGVGVQRDTQGNYCISILLKSDDPELTAGLPAQSEGCPVKFVPSGEFRKLSRG
jgi:hypothetical protein